MSQLENEYNALTQTGGFVELANRTTVRLTGADRNKFLHSFCTADINNLTPGQLTEAFILNGKGKIIGHVHVLSFEDEILLSGADDQASNLIEHLDKYIIRDDVTLVDATREYAALYLMGAESNGGAGAFKKIVNSLPAANQHAQLESDDIQFTIANAEVAGPGYLILAAAQTISDLVLQLENAGLPSCSIETLNCVRVQHKTPWFGLDIDDRNLPQELQRDEKAISFTKGCYLGQETVARIDAIGHVNQLLVGLKFSDGTPVQRDSEISLDGKTIGRVTSLASMSNGDVIGLGYVKRAHAKPETVLVCGNGTATVF